MQAIVLMLHIVAFCLFGKVFALHQDISTDMAYLCNQGGTVSCFLTRISSHQIWYNVHHNIHTYPS